MPNTPKKLAGLYCPCCQAHRLYVTRTKKAAPGLVLRYQTCSACGARVVSREAIVRLTHRPGGEVAAARVTPVTQATTLARYQEMRPSGTD